ncbi:MAG: ABC transporter permease [Bacteroidota bacterium]
MFKNNLKIALRHLWNQKGLSMIKIGGLAMGVGAFLLLAIYLKHEFSYDGFYPEKDRIYRVTTKYLEEGFYGVDYPAPLSKTLVADFPEVETAGRYIPATWFSQIRPFNQQQNYHEQGFAYVDHELLKILDIPMVNGDYESSMKEPNTLVISKTKAEKYFPDTNPVGKKIIINNNRETLYKVVGVFEDFPSNAHLDFDFMISLEGVEFWPGEQTYWGANMYDVYVKLAEKTNVPQLNGKLADITTKYFLPSWVERNFANPNDIAKNLKHELQPLDKIYLDSKDVRDDLPHGNKRLLWLFAFSGILIILIASINFINLSTAGYTVRSKEIGLRKVVGASKKQVVLQFLTETIVFSIIALILGIALANIGLPFVNSIAGKSLEFPYWTFTGMSILFLGAIFLGIITGIYPSLYLSKFKIGSNGQSNAHNHKGNYSFRNSLVVFQFAVSVVLIICTIVVYQQMQFVGNKDLGFNQQQVLLIKGAEVLGNKTDTFKEQLLQLNEVQHVSIGDYLPIEGTSRYADSFWKEGRQRTERGINSQIWQVDYDYVSTLGIEITEGRNFNKNLASDSTAIIISKTFSAKLGLENVIGTNITNKEKSWKIVGIYTDFHFESLKNPISPTSLVLGNSTSLMATKLSTANLDRTLSSIKSIWNKMSPDSEFRYDFLDESFAKMHKGIEGAARLFNAFAVLAIVIACLGLFSLTTFVAQRRKKEIGIRKVLGASVESVTALISREFLKLVIQAIVIAMPIGWYLMNRWLEDFAYHIKLSWTIFFIAGTITLSVAVITMLYQSLRAGLSNPIISLRTE